MDSVKRRLERINQIREGLLDRVSSMDVAVLAALNLANHLVTLREGGPSGVPNARIEALSEQVAALLEGSPAS